MILRQRPRGDPASPGPRLVRASRLAAPDVLVEEGPRLVQGPRLASRTDFVAQQSPAEADARRQTSRQRLLRYLLPSSASADATSGARGWLFRRRAILYLRQVPGHMGKQSHAPKLGGGGVPPLHAVCGRGTSLSPSRLCTTVDRAFVHVTLASDDVFEAVRGKECWAMSWVTASPTDSTLMQSACAVAEIAQITAMAAKPSFKERILPSGE